MYVCLLKKTPRTHNHMKPITIGIVVILIFGGVWWFLARNGYEIKNYPSGGTNIIGFGDSLVQGVGATDGNDFVSLLSKELGITIINKGRAGDTTETALARIEQDVLLYDPKAVLVLLGGNDFFKRIPKGEMLANLREIITRIQARGAVVVLLGVRGGLITDTYEEELKNLAKETGSAYVPNVLSGLLGNAKYMSDAIHPNDVGYKIIAE